MSIAHERIGDVVVLRPEARLDVSTAPVLREVVEKILENVGRRVLLDLSTVEYVSSMGIGACLRGAQVAETLGGRIALSGLRPAVRDVFLATGMDRVLDIYDSREQGLASFGWIEPSAAASSVRRTYSPHTLTLPEEILLLVLRDEGGRFVDLPEHALEFALAGSVMLELFLQGSIDTDASNVVVVNPSPVGDSILDPALGAISRLPRPRGADVWIAALAQEGDDIQRRVVDRLVHRGILERKDGAISWMLGGRRYPIVDDREQREVKKRVLAILKSDAIPDSRDVAIIALADACAVFDAVLSLDEMLELRPRIAEVARMDLLALAMVQALDDVQGRRDWKILPENIYGSSTHVAD